MMPSVSTLRGRTVAESADQAQPPDAPSYAPEPPSIGVRWVTPDGAPLQFLVNRTQLHGEACLLCGRMNSVLMDAGHMYTEAGGGWRARVCADPCVEVSA